MKIKKRTKLICRNKKKSNRRMVSKASDDFIFPRANVMKRLIKESLRYEKILTRMNNDPKFDLTGVVDDEKVHGSLFGPRDMLDVEKV